MSDKTPGHPRLLFSILVIAAMLSGGGAIASLLYAIRDEPPRRELTVRSTRVDAVDVRLEDVAETFLGYGTARPDRVANIAAEVAATVVERVDDIEAGSVVAGGQPLLRLDHREYQYALDRANALAAADQAAMEELAAEQRGLNNLIRTAESELRLEEQERLRVADLFERQLAAPKEYDFASLAYQQARRVLHNYELEASKIGPRRARLAASRRSRLAEANLARLNIERCEIRAPFAGTIESMPVDAGDRVQPGSIVLTIIDPSRVEIPIQLPAAAHDHIAIGASCVLDCESMPGGGWTGRVARVAASVDERTRTFAAYVDVDNTTQARPLVPGTFVRARVHGRRYTGRILIPRGAIRDGRACIIRDGVLKRTPVTIERLIADRAMVSHGLHVGDVVIVSPADQLEEGSPVRLRSTGSLSRAPHHPAGTDASP